MSFRKERHQSLSGALSVSLGLSSSVSNKAGNLEQAAYLGRSYLGFNTNSVPGSSAKLRNEDDSDLMSSNLDDEALHDQTADIADDDYIFAVEEEDDSHNPPNASITETSSLLAHQYPEGAHFVNQTNYYSDVEAQQYLKRNKLIDSEKITVTKVVGYIPSVILGLLLNILDALSYGMIIFPIGEQVFSKLGSSGISMFYVSCVVSQLVYSLGGSAFAAGIGSEMIEVTPFFHTMAADITRQIGKENGPAVIATTITTYAISSMLTGTVFYLLGKFKLGQLVGFFPRHILIGCIGGVGYFLIITGIEISSRLGSFEYNLGYLSTLFELKNFFKTTIPIILTVGLVLLQHYYHNSLVLPSYFIFVFILTHMIILLAPQWDLDIARKSGYMFSVDDDNSAPWYDFYRLYDFKIVHWNVIVKQIPSMFALTFFGILHVPINVPALAVSTKQDNVDVDRELIAHGISNFISGAVGSIQNYLVYTNSLLFIRAGADSRIAGVMLATATFGILLLGPVVIGFIPVCVVGSLIFLLGYELLKEALYDTWERVNMFEYLTIVAIVFTMGVYDFVIGIVVGIILATFHFLYENTKIPIVTNEFTGEVARSTVIRHPLQKQFLSKIGKQIFVLKLQSFLFFGSIGKIEKTIKDLFDSDKYNENPIKYLILDFKNVLNVDFSAAEGLNRIKKFIQEHDAFLVISLGDKPKIYRSLQKVGIFEREENIPLSLKVFHDLNSSLEWCENEFLTKYKNFKKLNPSINIKKPMKSIKAKSLPINTPRNTNFIQQAQIAYKKESSLENSTQQSSSSSSEAVAKREPLPLLLFALQGLNTKSESFWTSIIDLFEKRHYLDEETIPIGKNESYFIVIENGIITIDYQINDAADIYETYLPRTILGNFAQQFDSKRDRFETKVKVKKDTTLWLLTDENLKLLKQNNLEVYNELLLILVGLNDERFENVTGYTLIST